MFNETLYLYTPSEKLLEALVKWKYLYIRVLESEVYEDKDSWSFIRLSSYSVSMAVLAWKKKKSNSLCTATLKLVEKTWFYLSLLAPRDGQTEKYQGSI